MGIESASLPSIDRVSLESFEKKKALHTLVFDIQNKTNSDSLTALVTRQAADINTASPEELHGLTNKLEQYSLLIDSLQALEAL